MKKWLIFVLMIFFASFASAQTSYVVSNSENWKDVYSSMMYANLQGLGSDFLVSTAHGQVLLNGISKDNEIEVITSRKSPFVFNYADTIRTSGFKGATETVVDDANLELIDKLPNINNFIVVSNSYGYNAIAVAPYGVISKSWVFLADRTNIAEIDAILSRRTVNHLIVYGYVDREVDTALQKYNPEIINTGDKFQDNIAIVKKYEQTNFTKQVVLTNGEFIEKELMSGVEPVLFTGQDNVPDQIKNYLLDKSTGIEIGVLIGNDLVGAATNIRRSAGISVMVKFARGARTQTTGVSAVEGLDLFYLPSPTLNLSVYAIKYNKANSQIEITYKSNSNMPAYLKGTITISSDSGENQKVGDVDPIFIAPGDYKTITYPGVQITGSNLVGDVYTIFGEVPTSLDRTLSGTFNISEVSVIDGCEIDIASNAVRYNKQENSFLVKVKNKGNVDCFVDVELNDVVINSMKQTIGTEGSQEIAAGKTKDIKIEQRLDDTDLNDNPYVNLVAYYGEKQDSLVKVFRGKFNLGIEQFTITTYIIAILIFLLILLIIIMILIRRRDDRFD